MLDLEMTGLNPTEDRICEVAVTRGFNGVVEREFQSLVRPSVPMTQGARKVHGITDAMLEGAPTFAEIASQVREALEGAVIICHHVPFDLAFLTRAFEEAGQSFEPEATLDTLVMARRLFGFPRNHLGKVAQRLQIPVDAAHRAQDDARTTFRVFYRMAELIDPSDSVTVHELHGLLEALAPDSPLRLNQQRLLKQAFKEHKTVWIEYQPSQNALRGSMRREIAIWFLKLQYIQGWCYLREDERMFRSNRIRRVDLGERSYTIPANARKRI